MLELLVVIAVLGILAVAIITALNPVKKTNQAKDSNVKSDINQIANALQAYLTSKNPPRYPAILADLAPDEIKTVPKQQAGVALCASLNPVDNQGAGAMYCYGTDVAQKAVVWGFLFDVAVNPSTTYYCCLLYTSPSPRD